MSDGLKIEVSVESRELVREDPDDDVDDNIDDTLSLVETAVVVARVDVVTAISNLGCKECKECRESYGCWASTRCRSERTFQWDMCRMHTPCLG